MFIGSPRNVSLVMFLGSPRNVSSYVPRCHVTEEHNLCSSAPMSMQTYVYQDMFLGYVPQGRCFSVFGRGTFVCFFSVGNIFGTNLDLMMPRVEINL
jgi:hypothetical protein